MQVNKGGKQLEKRYTSMVKTMQKSFKKHI